jgi:hypothetical protein
VVVNPHDTRGNQISILTDPVGTHRLPDVYELNLRLQDTLMIGPVSVIPSVSVYNAANSNTVLAAGDALARSTRRAIRNSGPTRAFNQVQDFESPRIFQAAIQVSF